jgi:hypothetical protein
MEIFNARHSENKPHLQDASDGSIQLETELKLKIKRKVVLAKYKYLVDHMYGKEAGDELCAKR